MARTPSKDRKDPTTDPRGRCGTYAGYRAHQRRGERPCDPCRLANNERSRQRNAGERIIPSPPAQPRKRNVPIERELDGGTNDPRPVEMPPEPAQDKPTPPSAPAKPAAKPQVPEGVPTPPDWLKARGLELWIEVTQAHSLNASALTLLGEACRTADRLERMAAALSSRTTMWFEIGDIDQATELGVPVIVNGMIGEARQLQTSLRQTLTTLGVLKVDAAEKVAKSPLDQLAERRKKRLAAQGGGS